MNSHIRMRVLCVVVAVGLTGGCALSSPYVKVDPNSDPEAFCSDNGCSIDNAIAYSRAVRTAYRDVLDHYARLRSDSGGGIIGIGAAALGAASGGAHSDVLKGLGLVGATTLGYSTWYSNLPREALFQQTTEALVCAEAVTNKLRVPLPVREQAVEQISAGNALLADIATQAAALDSATNLLEAEQKRMRKREEQLGNKEAAHQADKTKPALTDDEQVEAQYLAAILLIIAPPIEHAKKLIESVDAAEVAFQSANSAYVARVHAAEMAGYDLVSVVDRIVSATDREAQKTLPDPESAFTIVTGLGSVAAKFSPSATALTAFNTAMGDLTAESLSTLDPKALARQPQVQPLIEAVTTHRYRLTSTLNRLRAASVNLAALAAPRSVADGAASSLDKCTIAGLGAMTASPSPIKLVKEKAASIPVDLRGGKPPYIVEIGSVPLAHVTITQPGFAGSRFVITSTASVGAGAMTIKVTDSTGRILEIPVTSAPQ
jgi:hypothetical protein